LHDPQQKPATFLLVIQDKSKKCHSKANTKCNGKRHNDINDNVLLIRFSGLAVVLRPAILAFDLRKQPRTKRTAPLGKVNFLSVALSAIGTGCILSWVLHESSKIV